MAGQRGDGGSRIIVLGAGYAGLTCFLELQDRLPRSADLLLVNGDPYHWFTTELHTYAAGEPEGAVRVALRRIVTRPGRLRVARVDRIDPKGREVVLEGGERLPYDLLVVGLGSDPEYFGLPGVEQHSLVVGNWAGAARLRAEFDSRLAEVSGPLQTVVAGGGLTGVEVAGELADRHPGRVAITILEAAPQIMAGFAPDLVQTAREVLEGKGIQILTGTPISAVEAGQILLKDGRELAFDLLVWAGGVRGSAVLDSSGLETTPRGRGLVDPYLRAVGYDTIYLIGDAAAFVDPATDRELPPTAQGAVQMGRAAGRNILRRLRGQAEQPFAPSLRGAFASLGRTHGVGQIGEERYAGFPAMLIKQAIEAHHAWETGGGLLPLIGRLLRAPRLLLRGKDSAGFRPLK